MPSASRRWPSSAGPTRAVTKAGQIKGGVRHEKDDRFRIDDRSRYVLGWSNERKINTLLDRAEDLAGQLAEAERIQTGLDAVAKAAVARGQVLAGLAQTRDFAEIDYQSAVNRIAVLAQEHARLKAASAELARLDTALAEVKRQIGAAEAERSELDGGLGRVKQSISDAEAGRVAARAAPRRASRRRGNGRLRRYPQPARRGRASTAGQACCL